MKKRGDWTVISKEKVYDNPWIAVYHHIVRDPSDNPGIYGHVHFKNRAIAILPVDENLNTWMVGQFRFPLNSYSWEIPEGGGPVGTDPFEGAKRELREETGLKAGIFKPFLEMDLSNSVTDESSVSYIALKLSEGRPEADSTENLQRRKIPLFKAFQWVEEKKIRDALSVASLIKLQLIMYKNNIREYPALLEYFKHFNPGKDSDNPSVD